MADAGTLFAAHRDEVCWYLSRAVGTAEAKELTLYRDVFLSGAGLARGGRGSAAAPGLFDVDLWLVH
jgi:hypothetical protein